MCKLRIAALCLSDSGTWFKNHPLLLEEGYILLHSDSGTISIPPPFLSILATGIGLLFLKLLHETGCKFFVWNIPVINLSIPPPWR